MSDIIQLLPDSVANQIAAGEVIQRPSSVVKELMENAVDAKATNIQVNITDAGRTLIQVIDNGNGMTDTDARMAFERHATSKIRKAADLFALQTMGFRGEALPSIAAVAQVELKTRHKDASTGTHLIIEASKVKTQMPTPWQQGCSISVQNLFYNVPARRKFLKSDTTELNHITHVFQRIALVYPRISFTLRHNNIILLQLPATHTQERIADIFGKKSKQTLLPVHIETALCTINGYVGKPDTARKRGVPQFFFTNGRYMRHPYLHKAVINVFERLIPQGEQIPYYIYIDVAPSAIDVNIHPDKTEIKFEDEQAIWQILSSAVRSAIGRYDTDTRIDFNTIGKPDIPVYTTPAGKLTSHNTPATSLPQQWEQLYTGLKHSVKQQELFPQTQQETTNDSVIEDKTTQHYQYKGRFIVTTVKSGLLFIEQHRAHKRILYEAYLHSSSEQTLTTQQLVFAETIELPASQVVIMNELLPTLEHMGFDIRSLGGNAFAIYGIPSIIAGQDITALLNTIITNTEEQVTSPEETLQQQIALILAQRTAITIGEILTNQEMDDIINQLFRCQEVNYTPDGQKILHILSQDMLDTFFTTN